MTNSRHKLTIDEWEQICELHKKGWSVKDICGYLNLPQRAVRWVKGGRNSIIHAKLVAERNRDEMITRFNQKCDVCGESEEWTETELCRGCGCYYCDDCGDWCHVIGDEPNGDYFCVRCQE